MEHKATYSPDDNKLRLYPAFRLPEEDYNKLKNAGFKWAPKQGLFVAPMWTPGREDLLIEMAGEIQDEDKSLVERQEERAERFEEYAEKREADAKQAHEVVNSITKNIPFGQPILIGHHSEKRARKDAERIENGMRKAVKMWNTSKYWQYRAEGALAHAKYKELPRVRANRIKKIEADKRRIERDLKKHAVLLKIWEKCDSYEKAYNITNCDDHYFSMCFPLSKYPRNPPASQYEGLMGLWSALTGNVISWEKIKEISINRHKSALSSERLQRWLNHYENRLVYEKTMLAEQGANKLTEKKPRPKQLPLLNYKAPEGINIENIYHKGKFSIYPQVEMTKADYSNIYNDYKGTREIENSHRVRIAMHRIEGKLSHVCVFLTDSKIHEKPAPIEKPDTSLY